VKSILDTFCFVHGRWIRKGNKMAFDTVGDSGLDHGRRAINEVLISSQYGYGTCVLDAFALNEVHAQPTRHRYVCMSMNRMHSMLGRLH
jgi:hypothetical protein